MLFCDTAMQDNMKWLPLLRFKEKKEIFKKKAVMFLGYAYTRRYGSAML